MIIWLYRQIQGIRKALAGRDDPEQLAWAMALGVLVGVVPKGNLVAVILVLGILALRINHSMAAVTAVAVSFAAKMIDPFTHKLGQWVLNVEALQNFYAWSWRQPLVPWTDLNNTVVMGSLLVGLMTLFPTYSLTLPMFRALANNQRGRKPTEKTEAVAAPEHTEEVASAPSDEEPGAARPQVDVIRVHRNEASSTASEAAAEEAPSQDGSHDSMQEKAA
ncbi:MAG: TIGR03546 family protein [Pirellulaceae bacterium]